MKSTFLIICLMAAFPNAGSMPPTDSVILRTPIEEEIGGGELIATRSTAVRVLPSDKPVEDRRIDDKIEIHLSKNVDESFRVWSKSHSSLFHAFQRCERLVFYDAIYENGAIWVLYSAGDWSGCNVYLDRVTEVAHEWRTQGIAGTMSGGKDSLSWPINDTPNSSSVMPSAL